MYLFIFSVAVLCHSFFLFVCFVWLSSNTIIYSAIMYIAVLFRSFYIKYACFCQESILIHFTIIFWIHFCFVRALLSESQFFFFICFLFFRNNNCLVVLDFKSNLILFWSVLWDHALVLEPMFKLNISICQTVLVLSRNNSD